MKLIDILVDGLSGEVYGTEKTEKELQIIEGQFGKEYVWRGTKDPVPLTSQWVNENWYEVDLFKEEEYEKIEIGTSWFLAPKTISKELKIEAEKTMNMFRELGFQVKVEIPVIDYGIEVIWVQALKEEEIEMIFGFHSNQKTKQLENVFFNVQRDTTCQTLLQIMKKTFENTSISSGKDEQKMLEILRFIQKQRVRMIL
jgi:hypothetical protein